MCILLFSSSLPGYQYVVLSNRDEFLARPTRRAHEWKPSSPDDPRIFGGRDLLKSGTWLGITKDGRFAAVTNVREASTNLQQSSRGELVTSFLHSKQATQSFLDEYLKERIGDGEVAAKYGGFSMVCGRLGIRSQAEACKGPEGLAIVSNRSKGAGRAGDVNWVLRRGETVGLSNSPFNSPWPKVKDGVSLLDAAIESIVKQGPSISKQELLEKFFGILSFTSPTAINGRTSSGNSIGRETLSQIIFVPVTDTADGSIRINRAGDTDENERNPQGDPREPVWYGTQKQSVILVDEGGHVTFVERTVYDENGRIVHEGDRDRVFEFDIEDWHE